MTVFTADEAQALLSERDLIAVGARGDEERRRRHGARTTFVRVLDVHGHAISAPLPAGAAAGEIRLSGKPQSIDDAVAAVTRALTLAGSAGAHLTAYSLTDLYDLAGRSRDALRAVLAALRTAGLETIAEAPVDVVQEIAALVGLAREAGLTVPRLTVHGSAEKPATVGERIAAAQRADEVQRIAGGVRAFAPLGRVSSVAQPSTGYDDVKTIAMARLLASRIDSIQVDWSLYGPKLAQVALTVGADDVDGVSALPGSLGRRRSPVEEIRGNIAAAGLDAVERDGLWRAR